MEIVILIPAYKPDDKLISLLDALAERKGYAGIIVVDDGSGEAYDSVFQKAAAREGVVLVRHAVNCGKGRALKTGIHSAMLCWPGMGIVTADCDGQHSPEDILRVGEALKKSEKFIVGGRAFRGRVPFKSRAGNAVMRFLFLLSTGKKVYDTQTGLRGLPPGDLSREATISGERYEYEMNVLLSLGQAGVPIHEVPIETIYIDDNKGSHFHPFRDAMRVFYRMIAFASASILSLAADYGMFFLLDRLFMFGPQTDYAIARAISSVLNFILNRQLVFRAKGSFWKHIILYYLLAAVLLLAGSEAIGLLTSLGLNRYTAKIIIDCVLYAFSFLIQRFLIFKSQAKNG